LAKKKEGFEQLKFKDSTYKIWMLLFANAEDKGASPVKLLFCKYLPYPTPKGPL
jgi:hypothetical protein